MSALEVEDAVSSDLARATGLAEAAEESSKRLNRVLQLTGFSDPVYAEAYVTVHQYDIVLDVTVLNRWGRGRPRPLLRGGQWGTRQAARYCTAAMGLWWCLQAWGSALHLR